MNDSESHLERYTEHARRLQTWLGAYGAGLATLLILHFGEAVDAVFRHLPDRSRVGDEGADLFISIARDDAASMKHDLRLALWFIGIALACQIVILFVNKVSQFYVSHTSPDATIRSWRERASWRIADWFWIDLICDAASVLLLAVATFKGLAALGLSV